VYIFQPNTCRYVHRHTVDSILRYTYTTKTSFFFYFFTVLLIYLLLLLFFVDTLMIYLFSTIMSAALLYWSLLFFTSFIRNLFTTIFLYVIQKLQQSSNSWRLDCFRKMFQRVAISTKETGVWMYPLVAKSSAGREQQAIIFRTQLNLWRQNWDFTRNFWNGDALIEMG